MVVALTGPNDRREGLLEDSVIVGLSGCCESEDSGTRAPFSRRRLELCVCCHG